MPRNEGLLDPGAGPLASFAWDLRALRETAGKVPYRVLAKRAGFCASTLSVAASGTKLPSLDVTLAYVQACGGDPETWRARWRTLDAPHPSAPPGPNGQPGLQIAPPYDADEHDEPAPPDAVALHLPTNGNRPTNREFLEAGDPGHAAEQHGARPEPVPVPMPMPVSRTALPQVPAARGRLHGSLRWRSRIRVMPIGRAATVALTLVTAVLGVRVLSEGAAGSPANSPTQPPAAASPTDTAMQQADALYLLIYQLTPVRADANDAIWDVNGCRNLSNAQSKLRAVARKRQAQVEQLAALDVSKVPDRVRLVAVLRRAWLTSAQTDTAYANIAADLQTGCTSGAIRTDPNYQQADDYAQAATAAKAEAARLWNNNADALGQLRMSGADL